MYNEESVIFDTIREMVFDDIFFLVIIWVYLPTKIFHIW